MAKKDYLTNHLNYSPFVELIKQQDFSSPAQFTTHNILKCLEQHENLCDFPAPYSFPKA
jgi:hypothetical protein